MIYDMLLQRFVGLCRDVLGNNLTGVYLHGSAAMGCFHPAKSDLDLIVVVEHSVSDADKLRFMHGLLPLNAAAPAKGIEMSIVQRNACSPFCYPTPFELHFSVTHLQWFQCDPEDYVAKMRGTDIDLAAHFTVIRHCGIALWGQEIGSVFAPVPRSAYLNSILSDVGNAEQDVLADPLYITLNLCRVLAQVRDGLVLSKQQGGEWALKHLPARFVPMLEQALDCYASDAAMTIPPEMGRSFAAYMLAQIHQYADI